MRRSKMWRESAWLFLGLILLLVAATAWAIGLNQVDDFEGGTVENWSEGANSPNPPNNVADGGPAGTGDNYLQNVSTGGGGAGSKMVLFNNDQWTGDYTSAGVEVIALEMANLGSNALTMRLAIDGSGGSFGTSESVALPANGQWQAAYFDVRSAAWSSLTGATDVNATLAAATELRLLHTETPDWRGDPIAATLGVDNITAGPLDFAVLGESYGHAWHALGDIRLGTGSEADVGPEGESNDGVTLDPGSRWQPGNTVGMTVTVGGGSGTVVAWIDWNGDGIFANSAPELIFNQALAMGPHAIPVNVPTGAGYSTGDPLNSRFRIYSVAPLAYRPTGHGGFGEVEDYSWTFTPTAVSLHQTATRSASLPFLPAPLFLLLLLTGAALLERRRRT